MNDLGRDVLFQLVDEQSGKYMMDAINDKVLPVLEVAKQMIEDVLQPQLQAVPQHASVLQEANQQTVFSDLLCRVQAAKCWIVTQRNLCSWVYNVYGFLGTTNDEEKRTFSNQLQKMIDSDLKNTKALLDLWRSGLSEFMLISEAGETPYIYGENFGEHLERKITLTEAYRNHEPYIDRDIIWRI